MSMLYCVYLLCALCRSFIELSCTLFVLGCLRDASHCWKLMFKLDEKSFDPNYTTTCNLLKQIKTIQQRYMEFCTSLGNRFGFISAIV